MSYYLSERRRNETIYLYACRDWRDPVTGNRKKEQHGLGSYRDGVCRFNDNALRFGEVFIGTRYEAKYWQWRKLRSVQTTEEAVYSMTDVMDAEDRNAGIWLLCSTQAKRLGVAELLVQTCGDDLAKRILSLVYFLARGGRDPLYSAANWSRDQVLPAEKDLSEGEIAATLRAITPSMILSFQLAWIKKFSKTERLSLDLTSVSSYCRNISDVTWRYNRDKEKLPQINLLMIVSQQRKMPVWIEQLPGAIADSTTLKDLFKALKQADDTQHHIVFDRGFASEENISMLLRCGAKFTMGIPLGTWTTLRDEIKQAHQAQEFCSPDTVLDGIEFEGFPVHAVTRLRNIDGHRVYDHFYYTDRLVGKDNAELTKLIRKVQLKLDNREPITEPIEQVVADICFEIKTTPVRGLRVSVKKDAIARMRSNETGFFAIRSNQFKSAAQAFTAYRLRDSVEKRFDDMKNQEDMKRLRVHDAHNMRARIFLQFLAQILRCDALETMRTSEEKITRVKTVSDLYFMIESIRRIRVGNHRAFFKRPSKAQLEALRVFGIPTDGPAWPSLLPSK